MKKPPIKSQYPPAISRYKGVVRIVGGNKSITLDHDISFNELDKYMIQNLSFNNKQTKVKSDTEWQIIGSKGDEYTIKCTNGSWSCTCMGYGFRRRCKHISKKKQEIKNCK
tara:strand:+ start:245 stop:577 length:333 start_codon:yes stop_codon:yes gene_type:complete